MDSALPALTAAHRPRKRPRELSNLLFVVAALVFAMVVVGGITRLTESGLSITEWKPVSGAIPPLTHADWQRAFDLYQQTPQYQQVAGPAGMTLAGFKFIFFWEWVHRLLGRIIGLVFFVGVGWFALKRADPQGLWLAPRGLVPARRSCRARSAGSWSCRASKGGPRSAPTASRRTCCSRCS